MATQKEIQYLLENFDYDGLKSEGFFKNIKKKDYESQIKRICEFLGIKSIFEYENIMNKNEWQKLKPDYKTFSQN